MKIYLPTCLAVSALAIFATTASSMESSFDKVSSEENVVLNASKLDSQEDNRLSFSENKVPDTLYLSPKTNSFSLDTSDIPASDLTVKSTNFGQPSYSVTTPIVKF